MRENTPLKWLKEKLFLRLFGGRFLIIGQRLFRYFEKPGVTEITIPDSVKSIGKNAFRDCTSLAEIHIPDSVTSIGEFAFHDCTSLAEIHFPDSVTSIGFRAFDGCTSLTEIYFPDSLTSIRELAFFGCINLKKLYIPDSVTSIGARMLAACISVAEIRLHPDDPALRRNYGKVLYLGREIERELEMFRNGDYDADVDNTVKYPLMLLHWLHTHDAKLTAYIRDHMDAFMEDCIPAGDICVMEAFVQEDGFFTAENIDRFIETAQKKRQNEIFMILLNYKNAHFGFCETNKLRL